jgi:hypothetical protein
MRATSIISIIRMRVKKAGERTLPKQGTMIGGWFGH